MTDHDDYERALAEIAALEQLWEQSGYRMAPADIIYHAQLKAYVKRYEQEVRNVPVSTD